MATGADGPRVQSRAVASNGALSDAHRTAGPAGRGAWRPPPRGGLKRSLAGTISAGRLQVWATPRDARVASTASPGQQGRLGPRRGGWGGRRVAACGARPRRGPHSNEESRSSPICTCIRRNGASICAVPEWFGFWLRIRRLHRARVRTRQGKLERTRKCDRPECWRKPTLLHCCTHAIGIFAPLQIDLCRSGRDCPRRM